MISYFLQVIAFQTIFLMVYDFLLRKETFFNYNRTYLLTTSILSLFLPFAKFESLRITLPAEFSIQLPAVLIGDQTPRTIASINTVSQHLSEDGFVWHWWYILYLGMFFAAVIFILKAYKIIQLYITNTSKWEDGYKLVTIKRSNAAFSFFNLIFLGEFIKEDNMPSILKHELIHIKQGHSIDLLWFEVLRIFLWFNPCVYLYQIRIVEQHEFFADKYSFISENKSDYYQNLLNQIFKTDNLSFVNHFYRNSLIKKRIVMMTKNRSSKRKMIKYMLIFPVIISMLLYTSCENDQLEEEPAIEELTQKIDEIKYSLDNPDQLSVEEKRAMEELFVEYLKKREELKIESNITEVNRTQYSNSEEVPFGLIDEAPLFQGCDPNLSEKEKKRCTSDKIARFVNKNFNVDLASNLGLDGKQRISTIFKIGTDGIIRDVRVRAPHKALEKEVLRVITAMPKFTPGKDNGEASVVPYSLPIIFKIRD